MPRVSAERSSCYMELQISDYYYREKCEHEREMTNFYYFSVLAHQVGWLIDNRRY